MIVFGTDFDDTLYFHDLGGIRKQDVEAIRRFQQAGNKFGLVSGRARMMKPLLEKMTEGKADFDFWIFSNGAEICDKDGNLLEQIFMPETFIREVVEEMPDAGFIFHTPTGLYVTPAKGVRFDFPLNVIHSCDDFDPASVLAVSFDFRTPIGQKVYEANKDRKDVILVANSRFADFNPIGATKGIALNTLCQRLMGEGNTSAAIGDSYNDLPMLEKADVSFTFHSSPQEVREAASHLVEGIDEAAAILLDRQ